jgi:hypothetical protein
MFLYGFVSAFGWWSANHYVIEPVFEKSATMERPAKEVKKDSEVSKEVKKVEDKKKKATKAKLKESLYPVVRKMLAENFTDLSQDEKGLGNVIKGISMQEDTLNEIDPGTIDWSVVAAALGAIGLAPFAIDKIQAMWKKKFPKSFEKAQSLSGAIDRQASGNAPGYKDRQIKPGQF